MSQPTRLDFGSSEEKTSVINQIGKHSNSLERFEKSHLLRDPRLPRVHRVVLILYYEWGLSLKEIADVLGVSEVRASQMHDTALSDQKKRIQKDEAYIKPRTRKRIESQEISSEIQKQLGIYSEEKDLFKTVHQENGERVDQEEKQEVSEALLGTFRIRSF